MDGSLFFAPKTPGKIFGQWSEISISQHHLNCSANLFISIRGCVLESGDAPPRSGQVLRGCSGMVSTVLDDGYFSFREKEEDRPFCRMVLMKRRQDFSCKPAHPKLMIAAQNIPCAVFRFLSDKKRAVLRLTHHSLCSTTQADRSKRP